MAACPDLKIVIIGAGMGGLATALACAHEGLKNITVYESAPALGEVGAGINIGPNLGRLLDRWNVLDIALAEGVALQEARIVDAENDAILSAVDVSETEKRFGYPYLVAHRAALHRALLKGCERAGSVKTIVNSHAVEIDYDNTRVRIRPFTDANAEGEWIEADVILAADGVKSFARTRILEITGEEDGSIPTGQAAYRILIKREQCLDDPDLLELIDGSVSHRWIGEKRHIIAYPISQHRIFNIVSAHPDTNFAAGPSAAWTSSGSKAEMLKVFETFKSPKVQKLLNMAPDGNILEWALKVHKPVPKWSVNNVALIGDACHPTLPHLAQGAAQAVEDGAVLGVVLSKIQLKDDVAKALRVYQTLRKPRADDLVQQSAASGRELHLGKGAAKAERDLKFSQAKASGKNPDRYVDKNTQQMLYGFDCTKDAQEQFAQLWEKTS